MSDLSPTYRTRRCSRTGEAYYVHRAIAAWKIGRELTKREVVHHVNGNPADNHPDNIWVFSSQRAHMLWHNYQWRTESGVEHVFSFDDWLRANGEWVRR